MRITGYRLLKTQHDWGRPVGDVNGIVKSGVTEVPIVLVTTDAGLTGVGLGSATGFAEVFAAIEGEDPRAVTALYDRMINQVFKAGHGGAVFGAIGALDMALWDLKAKAAETPLWRLLGGRDRVVPGYASGLDVALPDEELVTLQERFAERGFRAAKIKAGLDPQTDLRRLGLTQAAYRDLSGATPALMIDANEAWSRKQAIRHVAKLESEFDLTWVEEPVRRWDVEGHRAVSRSVRAGVASGENLTGLEQYRPLLAAAAVDIVQTGSVWGVTHFLRVAALAHAFDLPISPVAFNANPLAHAATAVPNHIAAEVQDLSFPIGLQVDQTFADGSIVLGDAPGLGITVDEESISQHAGAASWAGATGPHVRPERAGKRLLAEPNPRVS
ncbi:MAG TPA: mandelate racemase/muconate lactonizing enzyme family protein [Jiangellaceae bacterium]|nr:mandelate racemase/muconate lactonizing enzyme family protein [Jiangellaceae bacterium]